MLADKATRSTGELADYADRLLVVRGINLPYSSTGCSHSAADAQILTAAKITAGSTNCRRWGSRSTPPSRRPRTRPGATRWCFTRGCFRPVGPASTFPGTSRTSPRNSRACTSTRHTRRIRRSSAPSATGRPAARPKSRPKCCVRIRSKSINDILRPQMQALLGADRSQQQRPRPARSTLHGDPRPRGEDPDHATVTIPEADVATMRQIDPRPYDQALRDAERQAVHAADGVLGGGRLQPRVRC